MHVKMIKSLSLIVECEPSVTWQSNCIMPPLQCASFNDPIILCLKFDPMQIKSVDKIIKKFLHPVSHPIEHAECYKDCQYLI